MAWRVFEWAESPGTNYTFEPLVETTTFMEGQESRAPIGLHDVKEVHELSFNDIDANVADDIEAFIRPGMQVATFLWTPRRRDTPIVVKCMTFTRTLGSAVNVETIRLRFEQVFEPI